MLYSAMPELFQTPFKRPSSVKVVTGQKLHSGAPVVSGFIPAGVLIPDGYMIPAYDTRTRQGYQRQPQEARINSLANDLRKGRTDLPTAILLNLHGVDAKTVLHNDSLRLAGDDAKPFRFNVVDGQHRILALKKLIEEDSDRWSPFLIPFVSFLNADDREEMKQFYIVNSTAKSVKTDLALTLLRTLADGDSDVYEALQERGKQWQVDGQTLVEKLANDSRIWRNRIRLPSMDKGETTIPSASLVTSLKPLLSSPYFGRLKVEDQMRVIDAYWHGIREVLRPAFDAPEEYTVQKGVGVIVLHAVFPHVLECVRNRGLPTTDADAYRSVLSEALTQLQGENNSGEPVTGTDFWASAPKGAAGSYSSSAGRRVLIAKIQQLLPAIEAE
jgi:DGQHR domain-containing protein